MDDILLIGDCGNFHDTSNGVYAKNIQLLARLKTLFPTINHVNTNNWKRNPIVLLKVLLSLCRYRNKNVLLSLNTMSAHKVLKAISVLFPKTKVNYFVIGGVLPDYISRFTEDKRKCYDNVKWFMVESKAMKEKMANMGYNNVIYTPNFKKITYIPQKPKANDNENKTLKFVFLSRIIPEKGCDLIFEAVSKIQEKKGRDILHVDFYGKIDAHYKDVFMEKVHNLSNVEYKGFLMLGDINNYATLAQYDAMLFPTFWKGEGFPGILIDAMIAGTPVVASEWGYNTEIINDQETGLIIKSRDCEALVEAMLYMMSHRDQVADMAEKCQQACMNYDTGNVLTKEFFNRICK